MSELRKDPITKQWVIVIPGRGIPPREFDETPNCNISEEICPMGEGNEDMTQSEVLAIRDGGEPDKPGWHVRIVPNKFPALNPGGEQRIGSNGFFENMPGIGVDEIIIETPEHGHDLAVAPDEQIMRFLAAVNERVEQLYRDGNVRQIVIFRNHKSEAGMSLSHPHSQLLGLPAIPPITEQKLSNSSAYYQTEESCIFCDLIDHELQQHERIILTTEHFMAVAEYASRFPYGTAIYPLEHSHSMTDLTASQRADLAGLLRRLLCAYRMTLCDPPYNMVWQTAPNVTSSNGDCPAYCNDIEHHYHWHIEIHPRLTGIQGTESVTGLHVNPVAPEEAAKELESEV